MRRLVVLATLLAFLVPATAGASPRAAGDETLSVRDLVWAGTGPSISITRAKGALIGRCDQCGFRLEDGIGGGDAIVMGAERAFDIDRDGDVEFYRGKDVRWKIIGGSFQLTVRQGRDIDLSVVGKANVKLRGAEGKYAVNGGESLPVPPEFAVFELGSTLVVAP